MLVLGGLVPPSGSLPPYLFGPLRAAKVCETFVLNPREAFLRLLGLQGLLVQVGMVLKSPSHSAGVLEEADVAIRQPAPAAT